MPTERIESIDPLTGEKRYIIRVKRNSRFCDKVEKLAARMLTEGEYVISLQHLLMNYLIQLAHEEPELARQQASFLQKMFAALADERGMMRGIAELQGDYVPPQSPRGNSS